MDDIERDTDILKASGMKNEKILVDKITGTFDVESDKRLLIMAIPFSDGWSAFIDGEKVPIQQANVKYMAIEVPKGNHEIVWTYETPLLRVSLFVSLFSLILLVAILIKRRKTREDLLK